MSQTTEHQNEVIVLFDGYSQVIDDTRMLANCTCTLVKGKNTCTIVDTRTAWDGKAIVDGTFITGTFFFLFFLFLMNHH